MRVTKTSKPKNSVSNQFQLSQAEVKAAKHDEAIQYIKSAMNTLNSLAKEGDTVAKDSIVNLGVVAFDLQSSKKK